MTTAREAFGPGLRIQRERAGVTLEAIAKSTKIKQSLLVELENNDVSHWPAGIFRRAFFREYLAAIGIASESLVAEFVRLFPEDGAGISSKTPADGASELRLSLAEAPGATRRAVVTHVAAALTDLSLVFLLAGVVMLLIGVEFWFGATVIACAYYSLATAFTGRTPAAGWFTGGRQIRRRMTPVSLMAARTQLRIVPKPADVPRVSEATEAISEETPQRLRAVSG